jgi:demethylmenaquinone methyltransferase/2-methoxy-6-polyprenyl-1,4-benzoquinol methylase
MPFRATFDCLWCGDAYTCRGPDDLEGWAQLCSSCVGKAGDNGFLRFRLHQALTERGTAAAGHTPPAASGPTSVATADAGLSVAGTAEPAAPAEAAAPAATAAAAPTERDAEMLAYYEARAPEYDDWYLRRGRYERGPVHDAAWNAELDGAGTWLDGLPIHGEIVELAAGTGWWSPLLAGKGELSLYDINPEPLDRARDRLLAHRLRAHIHVRDAWDEPDRQVDAVFCGAWLRHVPEERLGAFLALVMRWLRPGGRFVFVDAKADPQAGAADHDPVARDGVAIRTVADGRTFRVIQVDRTPGELRDALERAGFTTVEVIATPRFFVMGSGVRPD